MQLLYPPAKPSNTRANTYALSSKRGAVESYPQTLPPLLRVATVVVSCCCGRGGRHQKADVGQEREREREIWKSSLSNHSRAYGAADVANVKTGCWGI